MSETLLIRHCSPTLAGLKTGNMFTCTYGDKEELRRWLRRSNRTLGKKGLRLIPLRFGETSALVYVYRPSRLSRDLDDGTAREILRELGYSADSPAGCVTELAKRLGDSDDFPHEIGLFLGYPPEDVCGFIENAECKCVGCWKVYGDEESAKRTFAKYKKCTDVYSRHHAKGKSVERLAVAH